MINHKVLIITFFICFISPSLFAETITTTSGNTYNGKIVSVSDKHYEMESQDGIIIINKDQIKEINFDQKKPIEDSQTIITPSTQEKTVEQTQPVKKEEETVITLPTTNETSELEDETTQEEQTTTSPMQTCTGNKITVQKHYRLKFTLPKNELKPHKEGDIFTLVLAKDYKMNKQVIFKKGMPVKAKVLKIKKKPYTSGIMKFEYLPLEYQDGTKIELSRTRKETAGSNVGKRIAAYAVMGAPSLLMGANNEELDDTQKIWAYTIKEITLCSE